MQVRFWYWLQLTHSNRRFFFKISRCQDSLDCLNDIGLQKSFLRRYEDAAFVSSVIKDYENVFKDLGCGTKTYQCMHIPEQCWENTVEKLNSMSQSRRFKKSLPSEILSFHHFTDLAVHEKKRLQTMSKDLKRRTCCVIQTVEDCIMSTFTKRCSLAMPNVTIETISGAKGRAYHVYIDPQKSLLECSNFKNLDDSELCKDVF